MSKTSALLAPLTPIQRRLLNAATDIMTNQSKQIDFLHTVQCQCVLPYRNPGEHVREWDRHQGNATLRIEAGSALDPKTNEYVKLGLPYGEMPRLVLIHLASEAIRTNSPIVDVEGSMTAFARSLGIDTSGPQLRHLKDQLTRLANATVRMGFVEQGHAVQVNTQIVTALDLWYPEQHSQKVLWPSTVRLSSDFFASLGRHAVPLDNRAIRGIAHSSLALDIYTWLAQRTHRIPAERPQFITWAALYDQFGQGYARVRDFRRNFLNTLRKVQSVYPGARMEADEKGMTLFRSSPPVASNSLSISSN
jgi:hypothetical protein